MVFQQRFKGVSLKIEGYSEGTLPKRGKKSVAREFQRCFKGV